MKSAAKVVLSVIGGIALFAVIAGLVAAANSPDAPSLPPTGNEIGSVVSSTSPQPSDRPAYIPQPGDFIVSVTVTSEHCFGSAGCSVDFAIGVKYTGRTLYAGEGPYTVLYSVAGAEDPLSDNFEVIPGEGGTLDIIGQQDHFVSTSHAGTPLVVTVTQVI